VKGKGWVARNGDVSVVVESVLGGSSVPVSSGFSPCFFGEEESSSCLLSGVSLPLGLFDYLSSSSAMGEWGSDFLVWVMGVLSRHEESCSCASETETGFWGTLWTLLEWFPSVV
jgi:hypothetical protein